MKAEINGQSLNYYVKGAEDGLPVVFIHGFPLNYRMWEPQLAALPSRYRAVAYDVRGHGESAHSDGQFTIEFLVDDLLGLMDYLSVDRAVLCGLSMGGYIALRAVECHPERFRGLILCDTRSEADTSEGKVKRSGTIAAVKERGVQSFADGFLKLILAPVTIESKPVIVAKVKEMIVTNKQLGICGTLLALAARTDTTPALAGMDLPTLILVGEHDVLTPPTDAETMQSRLPRAELHVIPGAGHMSNLENPTIFNEKILEFLEKI